MSTVLALPRVSETERRPAAGAKAPTDVGLMARMAAGDRAALQVFYTRHHVRVFRFVLRILGDRTQAEDVISEVFIDAWRQAGQFEGRSAVSTWLLAIARHKAYAVLRRRPTESIDDERAAEIEDDGETPDVALEKQNRAAILRRCLDSLPSTHREIIDLVYYHERSVADVAKVFGIPENTVKTRLFYARKKLAGMLAAAGVDRDWL
ncbi:RNA polymerase subunit sigma [Rhodoplanes elegans]|uniref:RNA polymerase subunit sigma n=1 Tax=Rhodoplanes elegans TaxID=29408 RepID=A0A327K776_9BRAD|nr:sigma-70 family RNA polymerase sigma factor [Rhodoplanes elegans]MBK5959193.1 RNA polymerase subunit sigma [Rhodoplanes elegans]RAI33623.1 RNA polymerase subunit sigma [Rhodoplanes elegans]